MTDVKIQIIIPTIGGREKYLYWAIRSCLEQSYKNYEILVSNNAGSSQVKDMVTSFKKRQIKLIETRELLPMAVHWEFALSKATGDVVTIIGDDDAIMPRALERVNELYSTHPEIDCITHYPGQYYWPDYHDPSRKNRFDFYRGTGGFEIINTKSVLKKVSAFNEWYGKLPFLYHGFVKKRVLDNIVESEGKIFKRSSPDIYSDFLLAISLEQYGRYDGCLTIGGQGAKSNGANFYLDNEIGRQFVKDLPDYLTPKYYVGNIPIQVFEFIEKIDSEHPGHISLNDTNWIRFAKLVIYEALTSPPHCKNALKELRRISKDKFPNPHKFLTFAIAYLISIEPINTFFSKTVVRRQESVMKMWKDASKQFRSKNVYALSRSIDKMEQFDRE